MRPYKLESYTITLSNTKVAKQDAYRPNWLFKVQKRHLACYFWFFVDFLRHISRFHLNLDWIPTEGVDETI